MNFYAKSYGQKLSRIVFLNVLIKWFLCFVVLSKNFCVKIFPQIVYPLIAILEHLFRLVHQHVDSSRKEPIILIRISLYQIVIYGQYFHTKHHILTTCYLYKFQILMGSLGHHYNYKRIRLDRIIFPILLIKVIH